jgi:hypothetical protein
MHNIHLSNATATDIDRQVEKVLRGLGNPEPPLRLDDVRELLRLDRAYYSSTDDSFLRETISKMTIASKQVLERPSLLIDVVKKFDLRALFLPDRRRILLDNAQPTPKQRWNEAHEIGHSLVPWHADLMLGDHEQSLAPACHAQIEAEANYAAGQLLFLQSRFVDASSDTAPSLDAVRELKVNFGNTYTTTFWRYVESAHPGVPMIGMIGGHPRRRLAAGQNSLFRYVIESPTFRAMFQVPTIDQLQGIVRNYCGNQRGGSLGSAEFPVPDRNGDSHIFRFESFFNSYDCLTLGVYKGRNAPALGFNG